MHEGSRIITGSGVCRRKESAHGKKKNDWTAVQNILLEEVLEADGAEFGIVGDLIDNRDKAGKLVAATIGQDSRHTGGLHLSIEVMQLDEAGCLVLASQLAHAILNHVADLGRIVVDEDDNGRVGGTAVYGIQEAFAVDRHQATVGSATAWLSDAVARFISVRRQLLQPLLSPFCHELVFALNIAATVTALASSIQAQLTHIGHILVRLRRSLGRQVALPASGLECLRICDYTLGPGVGVRLVPRDVVSRGEIVGQGRHWFVFVIREEVVVFGRN